MTKRQFSASIIMVLFVWFFFNTGCKEEMPKPDPGDTPEDTLILRGQGSTTPYIHGTFIDFWNKEYWSDAKWSSHMNEMKAIGIHVLFVQYTAYNEYIWTDSDNDYSSHTYADALHKLLTAADKANMDVFVGLYFNENYWGHTTDAAELSTHAQRAKKLADDIWATQKHHSSFAGWYISHEAAPYYYPSAEKFDLLKNNLLNPIANHCRSISDKPVATTVFFNHNLTDTAAFTTFMQRIAGCNLDVVMLQDGIGVAHCDLDELDDYFSAANEGLFTEGDFQGAFWADMETFDTEDNPVAFDVLKQKLENIAPHVRKIITYQYYSDMCPTGPNAGLAGTLREAYSAYLP